jgi:hypothetical protein
LEPRVFRELVAREKIPHTRLGKRVVARVEDVLAALDRLAVAPAPDTAAADPDVDDNDEPADVDALLARVGWRRRVGARGVGQ